MNRNHLMIFHAVANAGSITRGAEALAISQPAVSVQIAELEAALGVKLLDRRPRGVCLTEAGQILSQYARRMAAVEQEAQTAIQELRGLKRGRLAIGASTTIGAYLLPEVFGEFRRRHPQIQLQLEIANTHTIHRYLMDNAIDLGLTEGLVETDELQSEVFFQDELVPIAPPGHALLRQPRVTARTLCAQPLILREAGSGTREVVEEALRRRKLMARPVMSLGSTEAIKRAVSAGIGLAIVSRLTVSLELAAGKLEIIPVVDLQITRPLHLQRLKGKVDGVAAGEFLAMLKSRLSARTISETQLRKGENSRRTENSPRA